jgi:hypothetical protein
MSIQRVIRGEGSSATWFRPTPATTPALMVSPILLPQTGVTAATAEEIYRLAYEWAQAALQPSVYEWAQRACLN